MGLIRRVIAYVTGTFTITRRLAKIERTLGMLGDHTSFLESRLSDMLLILQSQHKEPQIRLITDFPVAITSHDHLYPRGTKADNTRYPRLCYKLEQVFQGQKLRVLDLGCSGGGLVYNFLQRGHFAIGLEGSDYSLKYQRAEWPIIPHHLKTCDITKPFRLESLDGQSALFDVVTAWEVLEHIPQESVGQLFKNIFSHLKPGGIFIASVAQFQDYDPMTGAVWHVTLKSRDWWENLARSNGFLVLDDHMFEAYDFPRGSGNGVLDWSVVSNPDLGFHLVIQKGGGADEMFRSNQSSQVEFTNPISQ